VIHAREAGLSGMRDASRVRAIAIWLAVALTVGLLGAAIAAAKPAKHGKVQVSGQVYADNDFELYVNGKLVASDPIDFTPFNVVRVRFRASYPMTFAIRAKDFADPTTGLEYNNTKTGDGGLIAAFSNRVVTDGSWRELTTFHGPTNLQGCLANTATCMVQNTPEPAGWNGRRFKASWAAATLHSRSEVDPHAPDYNTYDWRNAAFIWGPDLVLDNTVLLRRTVKSAPKR
jgi:hypothetical protein